MKKIFLLAVIALLGMDASSQTKAKVSVLGDSYSTFGGYTFPEWNLCWYNGTDRKPGRDNDVDSVSQTWWYQLIANNDEFLQLERNNSFSGSTVSTTGYGKADYSDRAFISRVNDLGDPDIIIVLSGTNDSWAGAPIGEFQYADWTIHDLKAFRPAFAYMLDRLKALYPDAKIINVVNSELSDDVTDAQITICDHYGVECILLTDIDKQAGHPSIAGMKAIADQLQPSINKLKP